MGHLKGTPSQFKGKKHSIKSRKLMSIARLGNKNCIGRILSNETKRKIGDSSKGRISLRKGLKFPKLSGKNSPNWKGDNICIGVKHKRIEMMLGKPRYCEHCKSTKKKVYDWSNKDHTYSLKIKDWQRLCRSCHNKYDIRKRK